MRAQVLSPTPQIATSSSSPVLSQASSSVAHTGLSGSLLSHPLERDPQELRVALLDRMRAHDPDASLDDLALERTPAASAALTEFRARHGGHEQARLRGDADARMLKSVVAASLAHRSGAFHRALEDHPLSQHDQDLLDAAAEVYGDHKTLRKAYGLNKHESKSIYAYSQPHKTRPERAPGVPNPFYIGPPSPSVGPLRHRMERAGQRLGQAAVDG